MLKIYTGQNIAKIDTTVQAVVGYALSTEGKNWNNENVILQNCDSASCGRLCTEHLDGQNLSNLDTEDLKQGTQKYKTK